MDEQFEFSPSPCWTCRRKRLKCDGRLPTCFKCKTHGRECLGYSANKPLVWTGPASRGKMATLNFKKREAEPADRRQQSTSLVPLVAKTLTDPIFQDLSPRSKQYLSYYVHRCCMECTLYEPASPNGFRQFLVMIPDNPALAHSILAISAIHQAQEIKCISNNNNNLPKAITFNESSPDYMNVANDRNNDVRSSTQYTDALVHSSLCITALRNALDNAPDAFGALIASVLLLIWVDMLDSGATAWKHHIDGLRVLVSLQRSARVRNANSRVRATSILQTWFEETFSILSLFGSTFSPNLSKLLDIFPPAELVEVLGRTESHSWTGCPADLLSTLRFFSAFSPDNPQNDLPRIFTQLQQFHTIEWAKKSPLPESIPTRRSLGEAWKGAIEIYGRRVVGGIHPEFQEVSSDLVGTTLFHLMQIDYNDTHFKGTIWPAFVVGAEVQTPQQRQVILEVFQHLDESLHMSTIHLAVAQLRRIWARGTPYPPGSSWVHDIWERGDGLLIV
ncbi:fungal-specific transcription factor domain-containing protein [Daldinia eschscholtzii]|nr:fungal-specific transcription factor domain-containing protein [Daldinia eschscholtzii]